MELEYLTFNAMSRTITLLSFYVSQLLVAKIKDQEVFQVNFFNILNLE